MHSLLVGAPQAKHHHNENVTGVVYMCDLSQTSERCQPIQFDSNEFLNNKGINGQWMGVRVTSQGPGRNVMMCAHRYREWVPGEYVPHLLTGQCYLLGDDLQAGGDERTWRRVVCDSQHLLSRRMDHDWFAYCQQGHGATFAKDNASVIFGAPGAYQWKGIVRMEPIDDGDFESEDPRETGDINQFDHRLIPLHRSSYLVRKGELTIVSGAPRGGYSGQVAFLKVDPAARRNLSVEFILSEPGLALASSFGYDLAVVDLNGDGFLSKTGVGGAVYIYINNKGTNWEQAKPIQLRGRKDSMFGLAVQNIGDINQDGFGDIAVGAPYENNGRVYIYCGSPRGINKNHAQVISPGSNKVTLFGYSLSGDLDVDNNHYPDLAIGALSATVFVYKAKPVVSVSIFLKITPNAIDVTKEQCQTQTCYFAAEACYRYTANPGTLNPKLLLNYTFEADSERRKLDSLLELVRDITDKLHKIPISVAISLVSSSSSTQTGQSDLSPVLNLYQQKRAISEITLINAGCGLDNICQSKLVVEYKFCSMQKQNSKTVFKSLHKDNDLAVITPSDGEIALEITVTNKNGDDAHQSGLIIALPDTIHYSTVHHTQSVSDMETPVSCTANDKGTLVSCELGNPLQRDGEVTFYVILATSGISLSTSMLTLLFYSKRQYMELPDLPKLLWVKAGKYEFRITNLGRPLKSFANISLNIFWPKENTVGKWLLYLTHVSSKGVQPILCSPGAEINPLKHIKGWSDIQRRRREVEGELEPLSTEDISFLPLKEHTKTLSCSDGLKCVEIRCPLQGLDSNALIVLHSHLWNTTFTEDYSSLNYLEILVDATLTLSHSPENIGLSDETVSKVKLTVFLRES
ncbi:hypothetical protein WMY93_032077 [Mugilogobius chulae]|uniref:Integrin alpha-2 domain-containing protein n=1 Tax=Mugilogobius chulae TaxID=88201 RepID=A0AAW0MKF9_9GOBI